MQLTRKIAITAGALTLGAAGVAAAAVTTPDEASGGLGTASDKAGFTVPVGAEAQSEGEEVTEVEAEEIEAEGEGVGPVDNHGAAVSAVAHSDFETGREHGEAVSEIARTNGGGDTATADAEEAGEEESEGAGAEGGDNAADQAELGADNAGENRP